MRYVLIDLSSDNRFEQPQIFGGYAGEHNETILQVILPQRMIGVEYSDYRFDFQTSEDNEIPIPVTKLDNGILSCHLTEQLTVAGRLLFNVVARKLDGSSVALTSKTNMVVLYIGDSPDGKSILPDPNGYKDEILEMIDARIAEINPANVDQTFNSTSQNAQSGTAVKQAVEQSVLTLNNKINALQDGKMDKFGKVVIYEDSIDKFLIMDLSEYEITSIRGLSGLEFKSDGFISLSSSMVSIDNGTLVSQTGSIEFYDGYGLNNLIRIKIGQPEDDNDAATKFYVDNIVGNINSVLATIVDGVKDV